MKAKLDFLNVGRVNEGFYGSDDSAGDMGKFHLRWDGYDFVILSSGSNCPTGWEHVSVSKTKGAKFRMPTWDDMCTVKELFWGPDETVVQFHPKASEYVNNHPMVLHLWKKIGHEHELPDSILVGIKT